MAQTQELKSNIPEFSVSDLAFSLKRTIEDTYGRVRVRGELSRVSIAGSGHMYSSLKDDGAVIDAVCWKGVLNKISIRPEEGMEVICTGKISTYPGSSKYQIIIETMELAGEGALLKMLEDRRKKLAAEGLFDAARKKPLPFLPEVIGVVTSPTGAVIRDILHRLSDRFPRHVLLWPAIVQGEGSAEKIAHAIRGFQTLEARGLPKPDVLIVGRGGGSLEDLMAFNEEVVVRAAAESDIPIISAVGHETDTTLLDYVADLRAPTPTAAAEKAVPVRADLLYTLQEYETRMMGAAQRLVGERKAALDTAQAKLGDPAKLLEVHSQRLDHLGEKMGHVYGHYLNAKKQRLIETAARLRTPQDRLSAARQTLERWGDQLHATAPRLLQDRKQKLDHMGKMLEAYSFENVLKRGYAVVQDEAGKIISKAQEAKDGMAVSLRFQNNASVEATVGKRAKSRPKPKPARKAKQKSDDNQGQLL